MYLQKALINILQLSQEKYSLGEKNKFKYL